MTTTPSHPYRPGEIVELIHCGTQMQIEVCWTNPEGREVVSGRMVNMSPRFWDGAHMTAIPENVRYPGPRENVVQLRRRPAIVGPR